MLKNIVKEFTSVFSPQYFKIIEECVSQIVLHRSGTDPDFTYRKRLDINFSHLVGKYYAWKWLQYHTFFCISENKLEFYLWLRVLFSLYICKCVFAFFFPDICVDKARLEECEERASELSRKVCNF